MIPYLALRLAVGVLGLMPEPLMRRLGRLGGTIWYLADPGRRHIVRRHMRRLGQPADGALDVFRSYGRYWAESFWVRPRRLDQMWKNMRVEGLENLQAALASGKGAVAVLPHLGNWEAAALIGVYHDLRLVAVAERLANHRITEWFTRQRNMFGIEIILTGRQRVAPLLRQAIDEGKVVCLLSDRDLSRRGVEVEFFGEKTTLPAGPVSLALKTGAAILPVAIYFEPGPGHRAVIHPPLELKTDEIAEGVQQVADWLEEMISVAPRQWHLVQPNWPSDRS